MEQNEEKASPKVRRKISFFKRRKRPEIRPFVRDHKLRKSSKLIRIVLSISAILFFLSTILILVKVYLVPILIPEKKEILNPNGKPITTVSSFQRLLDEKSIHAKNLIIDQTSSEVRFVINDKTDIIFSLKKDLSSQMDLVKAIDQQISLDGKQAISIDLRYNKPIVRY